MTLPLVKEVIALMAAPLALGGCKGRWFTIHAGTAPHRGGVPPMTS